MTARSEVDGNSMIWDKNKQEWIPEFKKGHFELAKTAKKIYEDVGKEHFIECFCRRHY